MALKKKSTRHFAVGVAEATSPNAQSANKGKNREAPKQEPSFTLNIESQEQLVQGQNDRYRERPRGSRQVRKVEGANKY